jgi:hypothetical protein
MKKTVVLISLFAIITISCEKQETSHQLHGYWKIRGISGSIMGSAPIIDFDEVHFGNSEKYSVFFNGTEIQGGSYKIQKEDPDKWPLSEVKFQLILHESFNNNLNANFYTFAPFAIIFNGNDTLTLSQTDLYDGYNYHFVRK